MAHNHDGPPQPNERPDRSAPVTETSINAPVERVWAAIIDPLTYPDWLVGARSIRAVDEEWPSRGSAFHHAVGAGPFRLRDRTEVVSTDPPRQLVLRAGFSALGSATVIIDLDDEGGGRTHLGMAEAPASGVLRTLWRFGGRQAMRLSLWGRNTESLNRLKDGIEHGTIVGSGH